MQRVSREYSYVVVARDDDICQALFRHDGQLYYFNHLPQFKGVT